MAEAAKKVSETKPVEVSVDVALTFKEAGVSATEVSVLAEIAAERQRQIAKGYDADHDDSHSTGTIVHNAYERFRMLGSYPPDAMRRKALIEMAAMVVAEIERHDRTVNSETFEV